MNWQRYAAIASVLSVLAGGGWWFVNNVVFADDFQQFRVEEQIRWLFYDEDRLWREYQSLKDMVPQSPMVLQREHELELRLQRIRDHIQALRQR